MSSAYIVLIALWYREATELESSAALHSAILLLKSQRHRWDETADKAVNILLQLMAASCKINLTQLVKNGAKQAETIFSFTYTRIR
jgi:hypothetical protein